jgi:alkanesulfonate monooxygenase SsuD/methylene tetrahydromethanopterin reductase-like flavin-dependent oxidoreductase (luciferase family)
MRIGVFLPPFDELADPATLGRLSALTEEHGWDGFFLWDHITYREPVRALADPWICLAAAACATERVRLGALVTPLARRRPPVVARQTASLDRLSRGRLVVGVGLGGDASREFSGTGEERDPRRRAAMLDEALEVLAAAWTGRPVQHAGAHFRVDGIAFEPTPVQRPRPPVWVAARHGNRAPLHRAGRWDGVFPVDLAGPDQLAELLAGLPAAHDRPGYDVVVDGPPDADPGPWRRAGATWWLAGLGFRQGSVQLARSLIRAGPPR